MQRLVYAPRVYAFIKNSNNEIQDVSDFITSGQVVRKVGAVSTASLTLRNPNMIFTTPVNGRSAFTPMDPITIFLKRLPGRPVRVFTGFLDKVPYLPLYPGTVTLQASCTLKRLLYTYFDLALPYSLSFLSAYGWLSQDGSVFNLHGLDEFKPEGKVEGKDPGTVANGSLGELLFATLKHIGHWDPADIYIEALPNDLFVRLGSMAAQFQGDSDEAKKELQDLLRSIVGEGDQGSASSSSNTDLSGIDGSVASQVYQVGVRMHVSQKFLLAAMVTGLDESGMQNLDHSGDGLSKGWRQEQTSLYPDPMSVPNSSERFYNECKQKDHGQPADELAYDVQRPGGYPDPSKNPYTKFRAQGATLLNRMRDQSISKNGTTADAGTSLQTGTDLSVGTPLPDSTSRSTTKGGANKGDNSSTSGQTRYDAIVKEADRLDKLGSTYVYGGGHGKTPAPPDGPFDCSSTVSRVLQSAGYSLPTSDSGTLASWGQPGEGKVTIYANATHVFMKIGDRYFGTSAGGGGTGKGHSPAWIDYPVSASYKAGFTARHAPDISGDATNTLTDTGTSADGSNTNANGAFGGASALAAVLDIPSALDRQEAVALQGDKSLLNDTPLLPFIQQLTDASLRQFQSLPDGSFFAFYPDYFGELYHRAPYWEIDDIEVLDGGVDLTDDSVVTHYYAVGDTTWPVSMEQANRMFTAGVIDIFNVFMAGDTMIDRKNAKAQNKKEPKLFEKQEALDFLQRYGARPVTEDLPMIHSPFFEMFLAYQRFMLAWSKQFSTPFTFTFMPELFPGGKVGFPGHGIQMYIEEVTHTFDYTTGFMTEAQLSAPSVYKSATTPPGAIEKLPTNMVKALIGPPAIVSKEQK